MKCPRHGLAAPPDAGFCPERGARLVLNCPVGLGKLYRRTGNREHQEHLKAHG